MNIPFLDLKRQYAQLQKELEPAVIDVLRSGAYIGGQYVEAFETKMRQYLNTKHVISCANGTDAIMLALRAHNITAGDEVITTPFTFFATAEAIAAVGATPVFVDVCESDFNIDPSKIEASITSKTRAILPVHIFGFPCNLDEINQIAHKHSLKVIEDAAQAIDCEYKGSKIGNTDNIVTFSFYPTKNLGAFGDAGMITTNNDNLAIILRALCEHGMAKNGAKARELIYGLKDELEEGFGISDALFYNPYKYFNYLIGYNSRLDAIQAAILSLKLKYLDGYNKRRGEIAALYKAGLKDIVKTQSLSQNGDMVGCYHQYVILTEKKEELSKFLAERGIGTGAFYPVPLHLQKAFNELGYKKGDLPVAEMLSSQTVCLPIFPELTNEEIAAIIRAIKDFKENK
jgi:dTDP-4-amino-4,6-dideoxygalactose transaminase